MSIKQFQGEVIESKDSSFTDARGEMVNLWKISLMLNDEKSVTFNIGKDNPCRKESERIVKGNTARISAEPLAMNNGGIKWKATQVEKIGMDGQPEPAAF